MVGGLINHEAIKKILAGKIKITDAGLKKKATTLRKQAEYCEACFPWPRLAASFRQDADDLDKYREQRKLQSISKAA